MADNSTPAGTPVKGRFDSSDDARCMPRKSTLIFLRQYARVVRVSPLLPDQLRSFFAN